MTNQKSNIKIQKGAITTLVLVFGSVFLLLFSGLAGFLLLQLKESRQKAAWNQALTIAEAGINYYRWHLAHAPEDLQDGQDWCCESPPCLVCGPYEHDFSDPEGGVIGKYSLEITGNQQCGQISAVTITSTGWVDKYPNTKRTIRVKYVKPTVADYTYLLNDNVWAGADREIKGPYHSNRGIRMDGENKSLVTSAREDWVCTDSFGCSTCPDQCWTEESNCVCPGVFTTTNGNEELFNFPIPPFDFNGITMDLAAIKSLTQEGQGIYLPPSDNEGYHLVFRNNRSIDVYEITELDAVYAYDSENGWHWEYSVIDEEAFLGNYPISDDCGLVFIEDDVWAEGEVKGKITTVSANLINPNTETDVWLEGNIEYTTKDGSDGLVLVGQHNNLIGLYVPDNMELHGIYIAQTGHFGRNHYPCTLYWPECKRSSLEIFGSIVSNGRVGTKWTYSNGSWASGFEKRENIYDPQQSSNPPPFLPCISEEHQFNEWEEME
jgi:hypothetical protein